MERIAVCFHAASPRKATVPEAMSDHGRADDATLGGTSPGSTARPADNLGEKSHTSGASEFSVGCGLFLRSPKPCS
jgi:hypothetical protein